MHTLKPSHPWVNYLQCFVCRDWSWSVSRILNGTHLCLPCYVDVLEVRQARGSMGEPAGESAEAGLSNSAPEANTPGSAPSPHVQLDMFGV